MGECAAVSLVANVLRGTVSATLICVDLARHADDEVAVGILRRALLAHHPADGGAAGAASVRPVAGARAAATGGTGETEPGMEGMLKGPYVAETFPVTIDQDYVVVEIGR